VDTIPATQPPHTPGPAGDGSVGVYGITVAAELAGMSVQALRFYERRGLLAPARTGGGVRRYSDADIARLRRIGSLIAEGINLTGIARVLGLEADNADLHADNEGLRARNAHLRTANTTLRSSSTATGNHPSGRTRPPRDVTSMIPEKRAAEARSDPRTAGNS
jgi:MerR family transcriptional regulator, heat shock protein HspR